MSTLRIWWSIQKDDGPKWGGDIAFTDVSERDNSEHPIFKNGLDVLKIMISETYDVRIMGYPEDDMERLFAMHPELKETVE